MPPLCPQKAFSHNEQVQLPEISVHGDGRSHCLLLSPAATQDDMIKLRSESKKPHHIRTVLLSEYITQTQIYIPTQLALS